MWHLSVRARLAVARHSIATVVTSLITFSEDSRITDGATLTVWSVVNDPAGDVSFEGTPNAMVSLTPSISGSLIVTVSKVSLPAYLDGVIDIAGGQPWPPSAFIAFVVCNWNDSQLGGSRFPIGGLGAFPLVPRVNFKASYPVVDSAKKGVCRALQTFSSTRSLTLSTIPKRSHTVSIPRRAVRALPVASLALNMSSTAAMASFAIVAAFDPLAGAEMQESVLIAFIAGCGVAGRPLPRAWSLLQLTIGDDAQTKYLVGAAVGNIIVMIICIAVGLVLIGAKVAQSKSNRPLKSRIANAAGQLNLSGWLMTPIMFLIQPTVACALASVASGQGPGVAAGLAALIIFASLVTGPVLLVTKYQVHLKSEVREDAHMSKLVEVVAGPRSWRLHDLGLWRVAHVGRVIMKYSSTAPWFLCIDLAKSVALGVCSAAQLANNGCSPASGWIAFVVMLVSLGARLVIRPNSSILRNITNSVSGGLCTVAMLLAVSHASSAQVAGEVALAAVFILGGSQLIALGVAAANGNLAAIVTSSTSPRSKPRSRKHGLLDGNGLFADDAATSPQQRSLELLVLLSCVATRNRRLQLKSSRLDVELL